eukprot:TRINITY_DN39804_c0_g1_i1.p1 TRINITY_DN39804_c0_g1~~TRINITY_DN39804_c0_g1_i1.p1  ORF type:complete len:1079 (+),score=180.83 TRINITY_DN39804_c0_g1_i1:96-3332(+)
MMSAPMWQRHYQPARPFAPSHLSGVRSGSPPASSQHSVTGPRAMGSPPSASRGSMRPPVRPTGAPGTSPAEPAQHAAHLRNSRSAKDLRTPNVATPPSGTAARSTNPAPGQTASSFGGGLGARSTPDLRPGQPADRATSPGETRGTPTTPSPPGHVPFMASQVAAARAGAGPAAPAASTAPASTGAQARGRPPMATAASGSPLLGRPAEERRRDVGSPLSGPSRAGAATGGSGTGATPAAASTASAAVAASPSQASGRTSSNLGSSVGRLRAGSGSPAPSPQVTQGRISTEATSSPGPSQSQRNREDQLVWLREKVRLSETWARRLNPAPSEGDAGDAGRKRLFEDNARIQREAAQYAQMQEFRSASGQHGEEPTARPRAGSRSTMNLGAAELAAKDASHMAGGLPGNASREVSGSRTREDVHLAEAAMAVSADMADATPRRTMAIRVAQLQRQLAEQEQDAKANEEAWQAQIWQLKAQNERLQRQKKSQDDAELDAIREAMASESYGIKEQDRLFQMLLVSRRDNEALQDELRSANNMVAQHRDALQRQRDQWREEKTVLQRDQQRRDKVEETLRKQVADVQARLDQAQANATEREKERRQIRPGALHGDREGTTRSMELNQLRKDVKQLEGERSAALNRQERDRSIAVSRGRGRSLAASGGRGGRRGAGNSITVPTGGAGRQEKDAGGGDSTSKGPPPARSGSPPVPELKGLVEISTQAGTSSTVAGQSWSTGAGLRSHSTSSCSSSCSLDSSTGSSSAATATRPHLCAVFGDAPLVKIPGVGWYFRLRINSVTQGWVGGFGIGITLSKQQALDLLPDRAARVPQSWIAGYWGRTFSNCLERPCVWKPQALRPSDEVGFLVNLEGECSVFVNDEERCRFADPPVPVKSSPEVELTALIDVSAAATSVTFLNGAPPPPSAKRGARSALGAAAAAAAAVVGASQAGTAGRPSSPRSNSVPGSRPGQQSRPGGPTSPPVPPLPLAQGLAAAAAAEARAEAAAASAAQPEPQPAQQGPAAAGGQAAPVAVLPPPTAAAPVAPASGSAPAPGMPSLSGMAAAAAAAARRVPQLALHALPMR